MMKRKLLLDIHLYLAAFFLPFLLLMPITGVSYLLGEKGSAQTSVAFSVSELPPSESEARDEWIAAQFAAQGVDFSWEYIKFNGKDMVLRPSSRLHYAVIPGEAETVFKKIEPNFLLKIIELHKGHGPGWFKRLETIFGIALLLITISGVWLSLLSKGLRTKVAMPFIIGSIITILALVI